MPHLPSTEIFSTAQHEVHRDRRACSKTGKGEGCVDDVRYSPRSGLKVELRKILPYLATHDNYRAAKPLKNGLWSGIRTSSHSSFRAVRRWNELPLRG